MKKYTLYIGLNDKVTKKQLIPTKKAISIAEKTCLEHTDGCTISAAKGVYKHGDGTFVRENTLRIELLFVNKSIVKLLINNLKVLLNQEAIVMHEENIVSEMV